jgi:hypothetical protein
MYISCAKKVEITKSTQKFLSKHFKSWLLDYVKQAFNFYGCFGPFCLQEWAYWFGEGLIFKLRYWDIHLATCGRLSTFMGPFGVAQMPQNSIKNYFLEVFDLLSYKNWPIDLVRGLFSSLNIGTYILPNCRPLSTFLGPFGGAQMPQNSINKGIT